MNPNEQQIAIAEFCGFTGIFEQKFQGGMWGDTPPFGLYGNPNIVGVFPEQRVPNYLNDLNAMWSAEEQAGKEVVKEMRYHLWWICDKKTSHHATAAQRAEALLRAIGKWKNDSFPVSPVTENQKEDRFHESAELMVE